MKTRNPRSFIIYGLIDPRLGAIRYVGKSCYGLGRPRRHNVLAAKEHTYKANWIKELQREGFVYEICILERCPSHEVLLEAEERWILAGFRLGWPLTNLTITERAGSTRVPHSAEHRAKISAAKKGKPRPDLVGKPRPDFAAMSRNRIRSAEELAKNAENARNRPGFGAQMSAENREKMVAMRKQEWSETGWRRTASADGFHRNRK